mgnify:CR=1 FL=1|jgi:hypothetical protein
MSDVLAGIDAGSDEGSGVAGKMAGFMADASTKCNYILDKLSPHLMYRWCIFAGIFVLYLIRIFTIDGWYIVTYGLGIYLLNQLIGFLSPQFDPEMDNDDDMTLPLSGGEGKEFKPFARRLTEFKFWFSCSRAVVLALCMTFFSVFDVPVFWPILLIYFIILFIATMNKQISHMIKHKYVPFSFGKPSYTGKAAVKDSK